jgi:hypothetical protein
VWETYCVFSLGWELSFVCDLNGLQFLFSKCITHAAEFSPKIVITQCLCAEYPKQAISLSFPLFPKLYISNLPYWKGDRTLRGFESSEPVTFLFLWINIVSASTHHCSAYSSISSVGLSSEDVTPWQNSLSLIYSPIFYDYGIAVLFPVAELNFLIFPPPPPSERLAGALCGKYLI